MAQRIAFTFSTDTEKTTFDDLSDLLSGTAADDLLIPDYLNTLAITAGDAVAILSFFDKEKNGARLLAYVQNIQDGHTGTIVIGGDVIRIDREPGSLEGRLRVFTPSRASNLPPMSIGTLHIDTEIDLVQFWAAAMTTIEAAMGLTPQNQISGMDAFPGEIANEVRSALAAGGSAIFQEES